MDWALSVANSWVPAPPGDVHCWLISRPVAAHPPTRARHSASKAQRVFELLAVHSVPQIQGCEFDESAAGDTATPHWGAKTAQAHQVVRSHRAGWCAYSPVWTASPKPPGGVAHVQPSS